MTTEQPSLFPLDDLQANSGPSERSLSASSTLESALPLFERYMAERDFSAHTRAAFLNDLKLFLEYLEPQTPLSACSVKRLEGFLSYLEHGRGVPLSKRSLDRRITTLKVFDIIQTMGKGGLFETSTVANEMYRQAFPQNNAGMGAAWAVILFILVLPIVFINSWNQRRMREGG